MRLVVKEESRKEIDDIITWQLRAGSFSFYLWPCRAFQRSLSLAENSSLPKKITRFFAFTTFLAFSSFLASPPFSRTSKSSFRFLTTSVGDLEDFPNSGIFVENILQPDDPKLGGHQMTSGSLKRNTVGFILGQRNALRHGSTCSRKNWQIL